MPDANASRHTIPEQYHWDLSILFSDDAEWERAYSEADSKIKTFFIYKNKLKSAAAIEICLDEYFMTRHLVECLSSYAWLKSDEDAGRLKYQEMKQRFLTLNKQFQSATAFIRLELLHTDDAAFKTLLDDEILAPYRNYLVDLRRRRNRRLGEEAENVLVQAGDNLWADTGLNETPSDVELIFKAVQRDVQLPAIKDEKGNPVQLTLANYAKYRSSFERRVRKETVTRFLGALKKYENILAAVLAAETKRDVFMARARGYATSLEAYLDRQDITPEVVEQLIAAVHKNLSLLGDYVKLRKKILGLKELCLYDLYVPLVPVFNADILYEQGLQDVLDSLEPMGPDYLKLITGPEMLGRKMVDVYPNQGKYPGAYAFAAWGLPPLVLLNYQNMMEDVSAMAHEYGHALHSLINMHAQPYPDFGYSTLTAEVASTFNEILLMKHMLVKYQNNLPMRIFILNRLLETIRTTLYRQTLFTEFELKIHAFAENGIPITAGLLNKTYADLIRVYYGPGFSLNKNDGVEWAYIPHFYWKHYVYTYACGLAGAIALSEKVANGDPEAQKRYLEMLAQPRHAHPLEILKQAGVDLSKPDAVQAAARLMQVTMVELEKLIPIMKKMAKQK